METKMDNKLDMFLEKLSERFGMGNTKPAAAEPSGRNEEEHAQHKVDTKNHRKQVAVSIIIFCCYLTDEI
jgi:hypothetical protein